MGLMYTFFHHEGTQVTQHRACCQVVDEKGKQRGSVKTCVCTAYAGEMRYAETWDYKVSASSFLQFDIAMGCSGTLSTLYAVQVQYSVDMGSSWYPVMEPCTMPGRRDCSGYHLSNELVSTAYANWTRISVYLPPGAMYGYLLSLK